jgi:hypothetical protein
MSLENWVFTNPKPTNCSRQCLVMQPRGQGYKPGLGNPTGWNFTIVQMNIFSFVLTLPAISSGYMSVQWFVSRIEI